MNDLRNKILSTDRVPKQRVVLKNFDNAEVEVRSLLTGQRLQLVQDCTLAGEVDQRKLVPLLLIATTFDPETGALVFGPADVDAINNTWAAGLDELLGVTLTLNGFDDTTSAVKNSESDQTSTTPLSLQSV
jgi:hypothetical protein